MKFIQFLLAIPLLTVISLAKANNLTNEQQSWLDSHNQFRIKHQVAEVEWSNEVAQSAQAFVNTCPSNHANSKYGENLAFASYPQSPNNVVARWYSEISSYDYQKPGFSKGTGHFTQVVWKGTTHIGCAIKNGCGGKYPSVVVCRYSPAGNFQGRFSTNVFPPVENLFFSTSFESQN